MAKINESVLTINLVKAVEKYPCLYNFKIPEYARKDITEKAWSKVAEEVKETVTFCKEKWKNLRTVFVRNIKPAPSGSSRKAKKPYYLNEYLQFLLPYIKPNTDLTSGNLPFPTSEYDILVENKEQSDTEDQDKDLVQQEKYLSDKITSNVSPNYEKDSIPHVQDHNKAKHSKKKRKSGISQVDQSFIDFVNMKKKKNREEDPRKMFLLSLLPDINTMTNNQMRLFKKKVLDVIDDILTDNLTSQNQIPITTFIRPPQTTPSSFSCSSMYSYNNSNNSFTPIHSPEQESSHMCNQNENVLDDLLNM